MQIREEFVLSGKKTTILPQRKRETVFEVVKRKKQPKQLFARLKQERTKRSSSYKEHKVNALASGAEEGRD